MRKGNKSDFINGIKQQLDDDWPTEESIPNCGIEGDCIMVVDSMAFIQRFQQLRSNTFFDLQADYLKKLLSLKPASCDVVHFVGDRYNVGDTSSLKGDERERNV